MIIDRVIQQATEKKIYTIDYSQWLSATESEILTDVAVAVDPVGTTPDLVAVAAIAATNTEVELTVSEGEATKQYVVTVTVTTSLTQIKADCIYFSIYATCPAGAA